MRLITLICVLVWLGTQIYRYQRINSIKIKEFLSISDQRLQKMQSIQQNHKEKRQLPNLGQCPFEIVL